MSKWCLDKNIPIRPYWIGLVWQVWLLGPMVPSWNCRALGAQRAPSSLQELEGERVAPWTSSIDSNGKKINNSLKTLIIKGYSGFLDIYFLIFPKFAIKSPHNQILIKYLLVYNVPFGYKYANITRKIFSCSGSTCILPDLQYS